MGAALAFTGHGSAAASALSPAAPETHTITGSISVEGRQDSGSSGCTAGFSDTNGYSDIDAGTGVTVYDGKGAVIGTGSLGTPSFQQIISGSDYISAMGTCTFPFTVQVSKSDFYAVEVSHRGKLNYSYSDLEAKQWTVSLKL